jgi:hypothetical protein
VRYIRGVPASFPLSGLKKRGALNAALLTLALFLAANLRGDNRAPRNSATILAAAPPIVLWAWEEPEDLRAADPARLGVAFLAERVFLGNQVIIVPRHQRILVPEGIWAEAVVRIEPGPGFVDNETTRRATADAVLRAARLPAIRGVEVDFDATPPQRAFYADVLRQVRAALPPGERLEITALVSWCAQPQGWMETLPIDAAVPMNFRLGQHIGSWRVEEPLCAGAVGISTDEPDQQQLALASDSRIRPTIYLFAPRPWTAGQLSALNRGQIPQDTKGVR